MPTLETTAGKAVEVGPDGAEEINARFRETMDGDGPDEMAPPKREPDKPAAEKPRRGRPRAEDKSRTTKTAPPVKDDYTEDMTGLVGAAWTVAASISYTQPYALILETNADALVGALAEGAKHNATIRSFASSGKTSWMLTLAGVGMNMGMQAYQMARDPELQERARAVTIEHLKAAIGARNVEGTDGEAVPAAA